MRHLKIGFVIFNPDYECDVPTIKGHWWAANNWIKDHNQEKEFLEFCKKNNISEDPEEFLMEYIGAIKLYAHRGQFFCQIPKKKSVKKSSLKRFYKTEGYVITGYQYEDAVPETESVRTNYTNQIICRNNNGREEFFYNPLRDGD